VNGTDCIMVVRGCGTGVGRVSVYSVVGFVVGYGDVGVAGVFDVDIADVGGGVVDDGVGVGGGVYGSGDDAGVVDIAGGFDCVVNAVVVGVGACIVFDVGVVGSMVWCW